MLNRSASHVMSTSVIKTLPGKLDIKRHSPSILYTLASLAMSTRVLKALPGKLDTKKHSPNDLYILASLVMSTSVLKALPGKLDIKRHSPSILYVHFYSAALSLFKAVIFWLTNSSFCISKNHSKHQLSGVHILYSISANVELVCEKNNQSLFFSVYRNITTLGSTIQWESRQASFPTGTVGSQVGIFLSTLNSMVNSIFLEQQIGISVLFIHTR